ncbi:MAG: hypothetical protein GWN07_32615 [Actinobacteria bacterium]|nr:hypothetical protein [Actinomycetota bacterium]NIS34314.1 hypothetical protein [Actinomycetota bacterium]NIU70183.1 hypothetical protein [Actinomycetota bacterium]NIW32069.1 hypothetical protein [Actinomycetota bacterium]NIX24300.1 hypothetical protein [Actinomycetota bacterium]
MSDSKKKRRPLHFALSGALLVPGLAAGCGPDEHEGPHINVPADDPPEVQETANPVGEEPPPEPEPTANPAGTEGVLEILGEEQANPAQEPPPPEPTPNPSGDGLE